MITPLLIEHGYKKIHSASSQIARSFWEKNPKDIYDTIILCEDSDDDIQLNNTIYSVKVSRFLKLICRILAKVGLRDFVYFPDTSSIWAFQSRKTVKKILKKHDVSYVHSIGKMFSSHWIALWIKRRTGIKWIAQFNDPWMENNVNSKNTLVRYLHKKLEQSIAKHADIIIHNNSAIIKSWSNRYGSDVINKIELLPLTYNIADLPQIRDTTNDDKFVISHIGSCYGSRTPMSLIKAVENFIGKYPQYSPKIEINFIGLIHNEAREYIKSHNLSCIHLYGIASPDEIIHFYDESNLFLAIDLNIKESMFFPSKLMTYYYYRKPILGISNKGSVLESELLKTGHSNFSFDDIKGIERYLEDVIHFKVTTIHNFDREKWLEFTYENVYSKYSEIIKKLIDVK